MPSASSQAVSPPPHPTAGKTNDFVWRLSVQQYHQMIQQGILTEDDPVELLEGFLVAKMPKNPPHTIVTARVDRSISAVLPEGFHTRRQDPITLSDGEPEPDVAVVRGIESHYLQTHPAPSDVQLVVEVSDSSLNRDRTLKLHSYARAAIATYWIVNLVDLDIEVHSEPTTVESQQVYARVERFIAGQRIPLVIEGREIGQIPVVDLLP